MKFSSLFQSGAFYLFCSFSDFIAMFLFDNISPLVGPVDHKC